MFKALAMVVLRFKDRTPREYKVPLNIRIGDVEVPIGLMLIFLILLLSAVLQPADQGGGHHRRPDLHGRLLRRLLRLRATTTSKRRGGAHHEHLEQFNQQTTEEVTAASLGLTKPYRKLVAIRSPQNLFMLEKALAETDPETTDVVVMTAKVMPPGGDPRTISPTWTPTISS